MVSTNIRHHYLALTACLLILISGCDSKEDSTHEKSSHTSDAQHRPVLSENSIPKTKIIFIPGSTDQAKDLHKYKATLKLLAAELKAALPYAETSVAEEGWPGDIHAFDDARSVVIFSEGGSKHVINANPETFNRLVDMGTGMVFLHNTIQISQNNPPAEKMLAVAGGYLDAEESKQAIWAAQFELFPNHPVARGLKPFTVKDQWYTGVRFQENMNEVTPILTAIPSSEIKTTSKDRNDLKKTDKTTPATPPALEHFAWTYVRPTGGRSFVFTGGHLYENWQNENFRKVVLNGIAWTAGIDNLPMSGLASLNSQQTAAGKNK